MRKENKHCRSRKLNALRYETIKATAYYKRKRAQEQIRSTQLRDERIGREKERERVREQERNARKSPALARVAS